MKKVECTSCGAFGLTYDGTECDCDSGYRYYNDDDDDNVDNVDGNVDNDK